MDFFLGNSLTPAVVKDQEARGPADSSYTLCTTLIHQPIRLCATLMHKMKQASVSVKIAQGFVSHAKLHACMVGIIAEHALRPQREGVRVMEVILGSEEQFGGPGSVRINPFITTDELVWPLDSQTADHFARHSLALSLAEALSKRKLNIDEECMVLVYLHSLIQLSDVAKGTHHRIILRRAHTRTHRIRVLDA